MKMNKLLTVTLATVMMAAFAACGTIPAAATAPSSSRNPGEESFTETSVRPTHAHAWVTQTIHHDETGHFEPAFEDKAVFVCDCGRAFDSAGEYEAHKAVGGPGGAHNGYHTELQKVEAGYQWVVDSVSWDEVYQVCNGCGAVR